MPKRPRKLLTLFNAGPDPVLQIADPNYPDWERIQVVYGHALPSDLRKRIGELTYSYLLGAKVDEGAAPISAVKERVESISRAIATFYNAVFNPGPPGSTNGKRQDVANAESRSEHDPSVDEEWIFVPHSGLKIVGWRDPDPDPDLDPRPPSASVVATAAVWDADCRINRKLKELGIATVDNGLHELSNLMIQIASACNQVSNDLIEMDQKGRLQGVVWDGASWDRWIVELTKLFKDQGLPVGARHFDEKNRSRKVSPFVRFIRELQKCIPPKYRPRSRSDETLAKAINDARRNTASDPKQPDITREA